MSPTEKTDPRTSAGAGDPGAAGGTLGKGSAPAGPAAGGAAPGAGAGGTRPLVSPASTVRQPPSSAARPAASPVRPVAAGGAASASRPSAPAAPSPTSATAPAAVPVADTAPRRVRLSLSRVNLWSVARLAFLLSVALGIIAVVVVTLLWTVLDTMGVFTQLDSVVADVVGTESDFRLTDLLSLPRVLSVTVFLAVVDVVLVTLVTTIAALLYNLASGLVGGIRLTLSDD